jgi:aryl-alcohol dehydrogenase-like predicted oxidoreductase
MRYRELGTTGLRVSELGVGCARLGGMLTQGTSRKEELALLGAALDAGINFFDTSDLYSQGESEALLGRAFRRRRSEVVIATKGGYLVTAGRRHVARVKPLLRPVVQRLGIRRPGGAGHGAPLAQDFSPDHLRSAVEGSLRRLGTDTIDLYQLHSPPCRVIESDELTGVLSELRVEGKIRHFGIAADAPQDVRNFDRQAGVASLQIPFSVLEHDGAAPVFRKAAEHGVAVIARSCYAAGLFRDELSETDLRALTPDADRIIALRRAAALLGRPLLEAALHFDLAVEQVSVTLLGMRKTAHLAGNLELYTRRSLSDDERAVLTSAAVAPASEDGVEATDLDRWNTADHGVRGHRPGDDRSGADDGSGPDVDPREDDRT